MPWSASQRQRLGFEKNLLEQYFPNRVTWIDPTGDTKVEVRVTCTNDRQYTLRVYLPADFPNSVPDMIVKTPSMCRLTRRDGSELVGSPDHVYGSRDGCTQICHFRPNLWRSDNTLYQVVMKGLIWLEAYQAHLRTGSNLSTYLSEMNWRYFHPANRKYAAKCTVRIDEAYRCIKLRLTVYVTEQDDESNYVGELSASISALVPN